MPYETSDKYRAYLTADAIDAGAAELFASINPQSDDDPMGLAEDMGAAILCVLHQQGIIRFSDEL